MKLSTSSICQKAHVARPYSKLRSRYCLALLVGCLYTTSSLADSVDVSVAHPLPAYTVGGNHSSYTQVDSNTKAVAFTVYAEAGDIGKVKSMSANITAEALDQNGVALDTTFQEDSWHKSFDTFFRNKSENQKVFYTPTNSELVAACNALAARMKTQGHPDSAIFSKHNAIKLKVSIQASADFTLSSFSTPPDITNAEVDLTCKKWAGYESQSISSTNLNLQEAYTLGGACKVQLSGTINTLFSNLKVKFRFRHHDGKLSDVKEVTTGANQSAPFNFQYNIPNGPGPEGGSIKIVGVSHQFESNDVAYSMNCSDVTTSTFKIETQNTAAADDLTTTFGVTAVGLQLDKQQYTGQCPMQAQAVATVATSGPGKVIYQVNHNGQKGPLQQLVFAQGGSRYIHFSLALNEAPQAPSGIGGLQNTQTTAGPSVGVNLNANTNATTPLNNVRIEILSPTTGVKFSNIANYSLNCQTPMTLNNNIAVQQPGNGPVPLKPAATQPSSTNQPIQKPTTVPIKKPTATPIQIPTTSSALIPRVGWEVVISATPGRIAPGTTAKVVGNKLQLKNTNGKIYKAKNGRYRLKNGKTIVVRQGAIVETHRK